MATPASIDGARLLSWARRCAAELDAHRNHINSLNVFPVPDSDTGSNMAHTMASAVREADGLGEDASAEDIASALAVGSIKGARGNSGIVLSQVLRGVSQAASDGPLGARSIADALRHAVDYVERAIAAPVEGTIVTVLREAAAAAGENSSGSLEAVSKAALGAAKEALAKTPSQLPELREAGVVDAGGTGLVVLLSTLNDEITDPASGDRAQASDQAPEEGHGVPGWLEVMFMFSGPIDELEETLNSMGRSLIVARASDTHGKVHIHTTEAGPVIEQAYALGEVSDLRLEILPDASPIHEAKRAGRLLIAVTPPGSLTELYSQAGAVTVAPGPDLIADLEREIRSSGAREVIVLPNGQLDSATLAEVEQAAGDTSLEIMVLPTVRMVNGIAACSVHDPRLELDLAVELMNEAVDEMQVADIARVGATIQVVDSTGVIAEDAELEDAVRDACRSLLDDGREMVTLLLPPDAASSLDAESLAAESGAEVLVYPAEGLDTLGQIGVE